MKVPVAVQGRMRLQLAQSTRLADLRQYIDGPVSIEWEEDRSRTGNWMPSGTVTKRIGRDECGE